MEPWICYKCHKTYTPDLNDSNSFPWGYTTESYQEKDGRYTQRIVGHLCKPCMVIELPAS
jgi:hypothetical protein